MVDLNKMTRKEFLAVEEIEDVPKVEFDSFVIIPTGRAHDSHYGCMKYVLIRDHEIIGIVGGGSDVAMMQGITWAAMDCLRTSRLIHVFLKRRVRTPWPVHSTFVIEPM